MRDFASVFCYNCRGMSKWFSMMIAMVAAVPGLAVSTASVPMRFTGSQEVWWAGTHYWDRRREVKMKEIAKGPKRYDFVFLGGTIVQNWEGWCEKEDVEKVARLYSEGRLTYPNGPGKAVWSEMKRSYRILNIAIAGDIMQHALWRLQNGDLEGYTAKGFVFRPDFDNTESPEDFAQGVEAVLARIAEYQPHAITLLMPILPRGAWRNDPERMRIDRINSIIRGFADGRKVVWCDINSRFIGPDGGLRRDLMPDMRYPQGKGYGVWRDAIAPYLDNICRNNVLPKKTKGEK